MIYETYKTQDGFIELIENPTVGDFSTWFVSSCKGDINKPEDAETHWQKEFKGKNGSEKAHAEFEKFRFLEVKDDRPAIT